MLYELLLILHAYILCCCTTIHNRVFDSLNYLPNMQLGIDAVGSAGGIVEAAGKSTNHTYFLHTHIQRTTQSIYSLCESCSY
jgi:hypothetical protein